MSKFELTSSIAVVCSMALTVLLNTFLSSSSIDVSSLVANLKRGLTSHHLIHEHTQRPPVHAGSVVKLL